MEKRLIKIIAVLIAFTFFIEQTGIGHAASIRSNTLRPRSAASVLDTESNHSSNQEVKNALKREAILNLKREEIAYTEELISTLKHKKERLLKTGYLLIAACGIIAAIITYVLTGKALGNITNLANYIMRLIMSACIGFTTLFITVTIFHIRNLSLDRKISNAINELKKRRPLPANIKRGEGKTLIYEKPPALDYPNLRQGGRVYKKEPEHDPLSLSDAINLEIIQSPFMSEIYEHGEKKKEKFSLSEIFDRTRTYLGFQRFVRLMTNPIIDPQDIKKRQDVVRFLIKEKQLRRSLDNTLHTVREDDKVLMVLDHKYPDFKMPLIAYSVEILFAVGASIALLLFPNPAFFTAVLLAFFLPIFLNYMAFREHYEAREAISAYAEKATVLSEKLNSYPDVEGIPFLKEIADALSALTDKDHGYSVTDCFGGISFWGLYKLVNRKQHKFKRIMGAIAELDAYLSIAQNAIDREIHKFPTPLDQEKSYLEIIEGVHPLHALRDDIEPNSIIFDLDTNSFYILTGPNMTGKTTLLKMIAVNLILAQMGSPVLAEKMLFTPLRIRTHINIEDSLAEGMSRFDVESSLMKGHIDAAVSDPKTIVIFVGDEMYEGTRGKDRQIAQLATIPYLVWKKVMGIVATHDLLLALLDVIDGICNIHFEEGATVSGEASWDYRVKPGASSAEEANALRIMERKKFPPEVLEIAKRLTILSDKDMDSETIRDQRDKIGSIINEVFNARNSSASIVLKQHHAIHEKILLSA